MLYPAMSELLKHIDSRYLLVNLVAHRARQIAGGTTPIPPLPLASRETQPATAATPIRKR